MNCSDIDFNRLAANIKLWGKEIGFAEIGITDLDMKDHDEYLSHWLMHGFHGEMKYLERQKNTRENIKNLFPGAKRIISCRMNYSTVSTENIAAFALHNDYHKVIRIYLQKLIDNIIAEIGPIEYKLFCGSTPVSEKTLAAKAGLGWIGKNCLLLNAQEGSYFFLSEIYIDLPLPIDQPIENRCGTCQRCLDACPTQALIAPYKLDARRCIAYLTIEYRGSIPEELRPLMGTQIFGCDACQKVCPWNRFAKVSRNTKEIFTTIFLQPPLNELLLWNEEISREKTFNTPISRISYDCWLRNIAIAIGNSRFSDANVEALKSRQNHQSSLVREHVEWALKNLQASM